MEVSLSESLEDYLLEIFIIDKQKRVVRLKDIAEAHKVKPPSVIGALKELSEKGLIIHKKYSYIMLTDKGLKEARKLYNRHRTIFRFLNEVLGVNRETAEKDAHRIEHDLTEETLNILTKFMEFIHMCPARDRPYFFDNFRYFVKNNRVPEFSCKEATKK